MTVWLWHQKVFLCWGNQFVGSLGPIIHAPANVCMQRLPRRCFWCLSECNPPVFLLSQLVPKGFLYSLQQIFELDSCDWVGETLEADCLSLNMSHRGWFKVQHIITFLLFPLIPLWSMHCPYWTDDCSTQAEFYVVIERCPRIFIWILYIVHLKKMWIYIFINK